jgi:P-type Ca2+ transporter type 2C
MPDAKKPEKKRKGSGIEVLHATVQGRLRLHIPALYRSVSTRKRIEQALSADENIHRVRANELTGTVLVSYAGDAEVRQILGMISGLLQMPLRERGEFAGTGPGKAARRRISDIAGLVAGAGHLFKPEAEETNLSRDRHRTTRPSGDWHAREVASILASLEVSDVMGLTSRDVWLRKERYGANVLQTYKGRSDFLIFLEQFMTLPVGILGVSAGVSILTGGTVDAAVILSVVLINAVIGFVTERHAERTILSLSDMRPRHIKVLRNGVISTADMSGLVPGDIVMLEPGSYVPADVRLLETKRLSIDESSLTGESMPVEKQADTILESATPLGERCNMAFMGTIATGGTAKAVVIGTGLDTELGQIQSMLESVQPPDTPIEVQLDSLSTQLGILSGAVCAGVFVLGIARGMSWIEMLKASTSLAVAAVPEGLPAVATSTLALGINEMRRHHVAIRRLSAVETLGSVQSFCFDKTGTLTQNNMKVVDVVLGRERIELDETGVTLIPDVRRLLEMIVLCNEALTREDGRFAGSATEIALLELARNSGLEPRALRERYPLLEQQPRAEGRPLMSSLHRAPNGRRLVAVKGSPAEVLARCDYFLDKKTELDDATRQRILLLNEQMAADALRVLGVAYCFIGAREELHAENLIWVGLTGMTDPIRPGMKALMKDFHEAGIKTVMITGDQSATAHAVARELQLADGRPEKILDAVSLDQMDAELLRGLAADVNVFARVSPAHKLRIVQAYQDAGQVVAMTGDGINDAPALKAADNGVAMGESGTDVARSVADVVLEDDNLRTMYTAVRQGRSIYDNIRKTIHFLLSTNLTEIEIMVVGIGLGLGQPLNPMQLLWINLLSDIFPGLALSQEPPEADIMQRPPRDPKEAIIPRQDLAQMGKESLSITGSALINYIYGLRRYGPGPRSSTLAFNTLVTAELLHAISCRSRTHSIFSRGSLPRNIYLEYALGGSLLAQAGANLIPGLRRLLGMAPLNALDVLMITVGSILPLLVNEGLKEIGLPGQGSDDKKGAEQS